MRSGGLEKRGFVLGSSSPALDWSPISPSWPCPIDGMYLNFAHAWLITWQGDLSNIDYLSINVKRKKCEKKLCLVAKLSAFLTVLHLAGMKDRLNKVLCGK